MGKGESGQEEPTLETRLSRLEAIVAALESDDIELERALELFEEGVGHVRSAEELLRGAELRVEELLGEAGSTEVRPFEPGDSGS